MIVTEIISIDKKKSRVLTDEGLVFALYNGEISKLRIHVDDDIEELYKDKILAILLKRARERVTYILKDMDKTEMELRRKLRSSYYPEDVIDATMDWATQHHYVDDERYARYFIETKGQRRSKRRLAQDLAIKGIDKEIVHSLLDSVEVDETEQILREIIKRRYDDTTASPDERRKLCAALARKGYSYESIRSTIKNAEED